MSKKMGKNLIIVVIFFMFSSVFAEAPDTLWSRTFGGDNDDYGYEVEQTSDGGFIIVGSTYSLNAGYYDIYLIKTDNQGAEVWSRKFGDDNQDYGHSVRQTPDGGYIVVGSTNSFGAGSYDVWLIKTDDEGNIVWSRTIGGSERDYGYSVDNTSDGGYIIVGSTESFGSGSSDVYLIKRNSGGNAEWSKTFGYAFFEEGAAVRETSDKGYIIVGSMSTVFNKKDILLIRTDSQGNEVWSKTFGGDSTDLGYSVRQTLDGGYIIAGTTNSFGAVNFDMWLIKTDSLGNEEWNTISGTVNTEVGTSVAQTADGGYIVAGYVYDQSNSDMKLFRTDAQGNILWIKQLGGSGNDHGRSVILSSDGGYMITGDFSDNTAENRTHGILTNSVDSRDVWLVKLESDLSVEEFPPLVPENIFITVKSNCYSGLVNIRYKLNRSSQVVLAVYNSSGQKVTELVNQYQSKGIHTVNWQSTGVNAGIYFVRFKSEKSDRVAKIILF